MQTKTRNSKLVYIVYFIVFLMLATQVFLSVQVSSLGSKIFTLEKKAGELSDRNKKLVSEIVSSSSLSQIEERSQGLGFAKPADVVYLNDAAKTAAKIQ